MQMTTPAPAREALPGRAFGAAAFVLDTVRFRPAGRRAIWVAVVFLVLTGLVAISYPLATTIMANRAQGNLARELASFTPERARAVFEEGRTDDLSEGGAVARLVIPSLEVDVVVAYGISPRALRGGAGHFPNTPLPGQEGNAGIAGHRTGYGEPFRHLDRLRQGDEIIIETPVGRYLYEVARDPWVSNDHDWSPLSRGSGGPVITLMTCDPPGTTQDRLWVRAALVASQPLT